MNNEIDLINIVKTLRATKFLLNLSLAPYQQQIVNYFNEYSVNYSDKNKKGGRHELLNRVLGD